MKDINRATFVGTVGSDPDVHTLKSGTKVAHLSLSTRSRPAEPGDDDFIATRTDWHRLRLSGRLAQFTEDYIRMGDRLYIEGRIAYNAWERDGVVIPTTEIVVTEIVLLNAKGPMSKHTPGPSGFARRYVEALGGNPDDLDR